VFSLLLQHSTSPMFPVWPTVGAKVLCSKEISPRSSVRGRAQAPCRRPEGLDPGTRLIVQEGLPRLSEEISNTPRLSPVATKLVSRRQRHLLTGSHDSLWPVCLQSPSDCHKRPMFKNRSRTKGVADRCPPTTIQKDSKDRVAETPIKYHQSTELAHSISSKGTG
jgi:hypothetical protein